MLYYLWWCVIPFATLLFKILALPMAIAIFYAIIQSSSKLYQHRLMLRTIQMIKVLQAWAQILQEVQGVINYMFCCSNLLFWSTRCKTYSSSPDEKKKKIISFENLLSPKLVLLMWQLDLESWFLCQEKRKVFSILQSVCIATRGI